MNNSAESQQFECDQSPLREAYTLLGASTPLELSNLYTAEDQILFTSGEWDYDNPELITNKIRSIIEQVGLDILASDEKDWAQEILWFWYHHAVSSAIWGHNDKAAAQKFSAQALAYQPEAHPNQITKLLYLLAYDHIDEAKAWALTISDDAERATSELLIAEYERGEILH